MTSGRTVWAALATITLLLAVGAALTDPAPWLYGAVIWLVGSIVALALWVAVAEIVRHRRRARLVRVIHRHPSSRGWDW